jgi:hypothetical protein
LLGGLDAAVVELLLLVLMGCPDALTARSTRLPACLPACLPAHSPPCCLPCPACPPAEAQRREVRALLLNRSKLLLAPASSAYKHSIK